MTLTIHLSPDKEAAFKARAQALGLTLEQWILRLADQAGPEPAARPEEQSRDPRPIWEVMLDNLKDVPPEEFAKLPKDGASEVDHYLYGHPTRNQ